MKYIIIEDEPLATERVREFAGRLYYLEEAGSFENAVDAITYLNHHTTDLIFLDINIGELSGIQFLDIARPGCAVVVLTAYADYAVKGFEMDVTDYLLKPFTFERFCQAMERVRSRNAKPPAKSFAFIKTQYRLEKVPFSELLYIEGARDYRRIQTTTTSFLTLETFGELEQKLPAASFVRIHKSYLVALDKLSSVTRDQVTIGNHSFPVSETYRKLLMKMIGQV